MSDVLAKVVAAPDGTESRKDFRSPWEKVEAGDTLHEQNEARNSQQNAYDLELQPEVGIETQEGIMNVTFGKIAGNARYLDQQKKWHPAQSGDQVNAIAVDTDNNGYVPVSIESARILVKRKPWGS